MVPITSDLLGYVTFWRNVVIGIGLLLTILFSINFYLLYRILQELKK